VDGERLHAERLNAKAQRHKGFDTNRNLVWTNEVQAIQIDLIQ
jgi:hypothetical protein